MRQVFLALGALVMACSEAAWPPELTRVAEVTSVGIYPSSTQMAVGESFRPTVAVRDAQGRWMENAAISFTNSDESVVRVEPNGSVVALAEGSATITVSSAGKSAQMTVTVIAAGGDECAGCWDY